jgi:sulfate adenylyltransferase subunit 1
MDDSELTAGKEYFVKVGTKMLTGVVTDVKYKIDVNTGEHLPTGYLTKNEIAACDILLSEKIVVDKFDSHKTLGELILIDRITNMTSACGVIEDINNNDTKNAKFAFEHDELKARGDIFEEFYYNTETLSIFKYKPKEQTYTVGDKLPIKGNSYEYPENFDLLVLRDWIAVEVRNEKITNIKSIDDYEYQGVPIINGRGFEVKVSSDEEVTKFLNEYKEINEQSQVEFFNKWTNFETYRKVVFRSTNFEDYII